MSEKACTKLLVHNIRKQMYNIMAQQAYAAIFASPTWHQISIEEQNKWIATFEQLITIEEA